MVKALATKNVVAVLAAIALTIGISFAFVSPAKADTVSDLQAQVQALLAQIQSLQGSSSTSGTMSGAGCYTFTQNLKMGSSGGQVMWVQQFLNNHGFTVASTGAGSPGNETSYFGPATNRAVIAFQNAYASTILTPVGLTSGTGNWFAGSRAEANALCAGSTGSTGTGTGTGTGVAGSLIISAGTQPANSLAPVNANRVPFTTFTLTNNSGAAVTINGIDVQRTGLASDAAFAGVVLLDQNGVQIGTSRTFNSNHQAEIGTPWTIGAGQSETFTVAGNMPSTSAYAGEVASVAVTGVDTSVPVSGALPITGASQTINSTLIIGTATVQRSSYDPLSPRSEALGTTGLIFSGVRITSGSAENEKLYSITWNQTGSVGSTDIGNLMTNVNGTTYPVTVDSTGKYFTSTFPGGITINEGQSVDVYIQGDLTGSNASGRTVEFDIYRPSDIYLVGQTYGYGITPTPSSVVTTAPNSANSSEFYSPSGNVALPGTPFYEGAQISVTPGTLSTISSSGSVSSQNIGLNVPNQPLGGFSTNFTGEPVSVQTLSFNASVTGTSTATDQLQSVTLVDQNGNVVGGPVNAVGDVITFNSSVTFPVGAMTYTIKGTVPTDWGNGATIQLNTNASTWTGAQGQTSGSTISLPNTSITMSTMTVQSGQLIVSAASTPAATTVAAGSNNVVLANINLDASQSGENVRLSSLPIVVNLVTGSGTTIAGGLTGCQLYNGTTALNSNSIGGTSTNGWGNTSGPLQANFVFQNAITIPKGTVTTLSLECNVGSSLSTGGPYAFNVGVSSSYDSTLLPTGVQSGNTIVGNGSGSVDQPTTSASGTMTVGSASLAASVPTPLSFAQVAGGTTGVVVGTFTLQPSSDSVNLQNVGLSLNSNMASTSDIARAYIYNGSTQVGSVIFTGSPVGTKYYATSSISSLNIPQNQQTVLTIKADINNIGPGQAAMSGHKIDIELADAQGVGASSGTTVHSGAVSGQTGVNIYRTYPTVALSSYLSSNGVSDGRLIAFAITANNANTVGINKLVFQIASSSNVTVSSPSLYAYTDSNFSVPAPGTTGGVAVASPTYANNTITATPATPLEIPAGATWYFLVKGTVSIASGTTYNIATTLLGDNFNNAPNMYAAGSVPTSNNFIWSPNSTTTSATTMNDWTNSYGVAGLPSIGITQNRTQ